MALTPAEHQRRYRERKRKELKSTPDLSSRFLRRPFSEFAETDGNWSGVEIPFRLMDIAAPDFSSDEGPRFPSDLEGLDVPSVSPNSIGRAELMVACLLDAATELAGMINRYKKSEFSREKARLEESLGPAKPEMRRQIVNDLIELTQIEGELEKQVRWTLPRWELK